MGLPLLTLASRKTMTDKQARFLLVYEGGKGISDISGGRREF